MTAFLLHMFMLWLMLSCGLTALWVALDEIAKWRRHRINARRYRKLGLL
jgi:hypothetical protein